MDSRPLKALHASLSCGNLENRDAELGKFWVAPAPVPGKMLRGLQAKCIDPSSSHKRDSFDENPYFFSLQVHLSC